MKKKDGFIGGTTMKNKHGLNNKKLIPSTINQFIDNLNSKPFIVFLEKLTSISNLVEDKTMEGAGISISAKGGFLNLHADFSTHPKDPFLVRKLNVLYYLNKDWHQDYKGDLEFWSKDMKYCELKIAPIFNRLVIFSTSETSYHGFPDPICCPDNIYRKSIALYYFNKTEVKNKLVTTTYKTKPGEKLKSIPVWLDNKLIYVYTLLKRKLKINDQYISKLLGVEFKKQNNSKSKKQ
jgi:Rps23 Pro-64 3,4-dihydroxylase Tpa1-like proline 4-hydroxylase